MGFTHQSRYPRCRQNDRDRHRRNAWGPRAVSRCNPLRRSRISVERCLIGRHGGSNTGGGLWPGKLCAANVCHAFSSGRARTLEWLLEKTATPNTPATKIDEVGGERPYE